MDDRSACWNRRDFLGATLGFGAAMLLAPGGASGDDDAKPLKLGFDNFSIRDFDWKAPRLIEYAQSLRVDTLLLSDLNVYESFDDAYLRGVRDQAERSGIELQVGTSSICPTSRSYDERKWGRAEDHARLLIRTAKRLGSSVARCYLGSRQDREGDGGIERHIEAMVKVLQAVRSEAEDAQVKIAIENHAGDMQAWELAELIEAAGTSYVGATMDPGNATWALEDPMVNLEILGPYAVTTGIRDSAVWETASGATSMWVNMGEGIVDWPKYVARFRQLCPDTPFVLEVISYKWAFEMPYLQPEMWSKYPKARAGEFARFVALAKHGRPFQVPAARPTGDASRELEQSQQKYDLEVCLQYCRDVLGLGLNRGQ